MIIPVAAFTALALSCAPDVAPETLAAIARTESSFETLAIHDNNDRKSYRPGGKTEAVDLARQLLAAGHSLDLGIMQVNTANFGWVELTLEDAFEPCASIRAGATVLIQISRYNTGSPRAGFANGYVRRVLDSRQLIAKGGASADSPKAPPEVKHDWDVFPDETDKTDEQQKAASPEQTPAAPVELPPVTVTAVPVSQADAHDQQNVAENALVIQEKP